MKTKQEILDWFNQANEIKEAVDALIPNDAIDDPIIEEPKEDIVDENGLVFPYNTYFLKPNEDGQFTKQMVETAVNNGETYIAFDTPKLDIYYANSLHTFRNDWKGYLYLEIKGTDEKPVTLDFRKVFIDCHPDKNNIRLKHSCFAFYNSENLVLKFGKVEGDKFKRDLNTNQETTFEETHLYFQGQSCYNITFDGGDVSGFMADMVESSPYGVTIATNMLGKEYYLQPNGRYESIFYNIDTNIDNTFGLIGGLGFNRLLYYDMEDIVFKFYDENENLISQIENAKYYEVYKFAEGTKKLKVNLKEMDGRKESPTNFGHRLDYNPQRKSKVLNANIYDNHRGGIANIGANATIENCNFYNTNRYFEVPEFGTLNSAYTTRYHINCEDVVSRNLLIKNCNFKDKFHHLLLTHNINADIIENTFEGTPFNIFIYYLLYGKISQNIFSKGIVNAGVGTNKGTVLVEGNTGSPQVQLTQGAHWFNNDFIDGKLQGQGKCDKNTFTNYDYSYFRWTKDILDNDFIGVKSTPYTRSGAYIYKNNFKDAYFRFSHDSHLSEPIVFDGVSIDNTESPLIYGFERTGNAVPVIAVNGKFSGFKMSNIFVNRPIDFVYPSYYFENVEFDQIDNHFMLLGNNSQTNNPIKFYFKNCTFNGSGDFLKTQWGGMNYEVYFDNCTIDENINLNIEYSETVIPMPLFKAPRTQPVLPLSYNVDHTFVNPDFHVYQLLIRNKNTKQIVLNQDVTKRYKHFNNSPQDFEYSIDGGVYWDSL